jgi:hypothetical protein
MKANKFLVVVGGHAEVAIHSEFFVDCRSSK